MIAEARYFIEGAIIKYATALARDLEFDLKELDDFLAEFMQDVDEYLTKLDPEKLDADLLSDASPVHRAVAILRKRYIISYLDKSPNKLCFFCPKLYLLEILKEHFPDANDLDAPSDGHPYTRIYRESDDIIRELLAIQSKLGVPFEPKRSPERGKDGELEPPAPPTLAHPQLLLKAHKVPSKFRTLACCTNFVLAPLGRLLSNGLSALEPVLRCIWYSTFRDCRELPKDFPIPAFPFLANSSDLVPIVMGLNSSIPVSQRAQPVTNRCYDVEQMYTGLVQSELIADLIEVVNEVWWIDLRETRKFLLQ